MLQAPPAPRQVLPRNIVTPSKASRLVWKRRQSVSLSLYSTRSVIDPREPVSAFAQERACPFACARSAEETALRIVSTSELRAGSAVLPEPVAIEPVTIDGSTSALRRSNPEAQAESGSAARRPISSFERFAPLAQQSPGRNACAWRNNRQSPRRQSVRKREL